MIDEELQEVHALVSQEVMWQWISSYHNYKARKLESETTWKTCHEQVVKYLGELESPHPTSFIGRLQILLGILIVSNKLLDDHAHIH